MDSFEYSVPIAFVHIFHPRPFVLTLIPQAAITNWFADHWASYVDGR